MIGPDLCKIHPVDVDKQQERFLIWAEAREAPCRPSFWEAVPGPANPGFLDADRRSAALWKCHRREAT